MYKSYKRVRRGGGVALALLWALLSGLGAAAQSGPIGNEWIVPGQQYYKVKILTDGLYRLDYQYLAQAGIAGVAPEQLQIWRRGRELARYVGGNTAVLDPTTFVEFYAVHNDGKLDGELYKDPKDQPHQLFDFYTDTASYFITWGVGAAARAGRPMAQPTAAGGEPHAYRLTEQLALHTEAIADRNYANNIHDDHVYLPWLEPVEGYFWTLVNKEYTTDKTAAADSTLRSISALGPAPTVEVLLVGDSEAPHVTEVLVVPPGGTERRLGLMQYVGFEKARQTFGLLRSDINKAGKVVLRFRVSPPPTTGNRDFFALCYVRIVAPQTNRWFANRRSIAFQNDSLLGGPAAYELDSIPATVAGFDVHDIYNVQRIVSTAGTGTSRRFVFPDATANATRRLLLADESRLLVPPLPARRVHFRQIDPAKSNFIIITHPQLMKPGPGTANAALAYASYRANPGNGLPRYDTLMVTTNQLYDQFRYGDRSWLALRHFARWMAAATPDRTDRYQLLLGKGIVSNVTSEKINGQPVRKAGEGGVDLVPTNSHSVSDNMLTADIEHNDFAARLNTGRLAVTTPAQVMAYLAKMREYDLKVQEYDPQNPELWRKNVLHLTGGTKDYEIASFRDYMNRYKQRVERPLFGGNVTTVERTTVNPTSGSLLVRTNIGAYLNPGLGLITYLGHASTTRFSLDIGVPDDPDNGYNNAGKYPVLMFNGCLAGNLFTTGPTFGENWLFTPGKGAIGLMGQYGDAFPTELDQAQDSLYSLLFNNPQWYGKPITAVYNEMVRRVQRSSGPLSKLTSDIASEQLLCTIWHGDPTISLYAPPKPDFVASNAALSISPGAGQTEVNAASSSFLLNIGVINPGRVTRDSIEIRVTRTFDPSRTPTPPNSVTTYRFAQGPQGNGTYSVQLTNPAGVNVFGNNTFLVELDYRNKVSEMSETNNTAQTTFTFLRGGVTLLNPVEFAIVGNNRPRLVAQTNIPNGAQRVYEFEADTAAAFSSPLRQQTTVSAVLTPSWRPTLPGTGHDSTVWYWRVRFQAPAADEDANWVVGSFRIIQGRYAGGWSQSHYAQFQRDQRQGVAVSAPAGHWTFSTENKPLTLRTRGGGLPGSPATFGQGAGFGITVDVATPATVANCAVYTPNVLVAVYDQHTLRPKDGLPGAIICGQPPQQFYVFGVDAPYNQPGDTLNTLNSNVARQTQLADFLAAVPDGDYVAIVSMNRLRWPSLTTVKTAFSTLLGSRLVGQLQNGDPFTLLAQKRAGGGHLIRELGPTASSPAVPRYNQTITLLDTLRTPTTHGTITSTRIGPAKQWESLYHWIQRESGATSRYTLRVLGIDTLGQATVLHASVPPAAGRAGLALGAISATRYPYLQLELALQDSVNRIAPQLKEWFVTYQGVPEGVVRRDLAVPGTAYDPATLAAQATSTGTLTIPVVFENVTPFDFGTPLRAKVELRDTNPPFNLRIPPVMVTAPRPLKGDSTITIMAAVPVKGVFGSFSTKVTVNPRPHALPELNLFNNELNLDPFSVGDNSLPPTLDVAFDGRHILNGELVSPTPIINIQLNDEDRVRHITDRTAFTVTLLKPAGGLPTLVDLNGPEVNFSVDVAQGSVAKLEYRPGLGKPLADGMYTLRVQGRDATNAAAGTQDFQVKFEVVNASKITNVYPYPNPVINKARFVFTVTGQELPRNMKIQILSLTGRVVREIFMNELGPLHIGNNISDFAWDGTDSFGDRLANGTYLYRVSLDNPNGQFSHRETAGDRAFKNDWGKLVLMR